MNVEKRDNNKRQMHFILLLSNGNGSEMLVVIVG